MLMLSLVRTLAVLLPPVVRLMIWLLARALNMPEPLVHAAGLFVFARVLAFENSIGQSLCPVHLARRLWSWLRSPFAATGGGIRTSRPPDRPNRTYRQARTSACACEYACRKK